MFQSENVPPSNVAGAPLRKAAATQNLTTSASSSSLMMRSTSQDSHTSSWSGSDTARLPFSIFREQQQSEDDLDEEEMESAIPSPYARQRNRRRNKSAPRPPLQDLPVPLAQQQDQMNASMASCHEDNANNASLMEVSQDRGEDDDDDEVVVVDNDEDEVVVADESVAEALLSASVLEEQSDALDMQDYQADIYQYLRQFEVRILTINSLHC